MNSHAPRFHIRRLLAMCLVVLSVPAVNPAYAKRAQAAKVKPVVHEGVRYTAPNADGRRAVVEAWDVAGGQKLWSVTVFKTFINPFLEADVQWVFIKALSLEGGRLVVLAESGQSYFVDLKSHAVTKR